MSEFRNCCLMQFPAVHSAQCITAHQSTTRTSLHTPHYRQKLLTSNTLHTSIFYHLTGNLTKTVIFLAVKWCRRNINIFIFLFIYFTYLLSLYSYLFIYYVYIFIYFLFIFLFIYLHSYLFISFIYLLCLYNYIFLFMFLFVFLLLSPRRRQHNWHRNADSNCIIKITVIKPTCICWCFQ